MKLFNDNRITSINKDTLLNSKQYARSLTVDKYPDLDKEWYIDQVNKIIENVTQTSIN